MRKIICGALLLCAALGWHGCGPRQAETRPARDAPTQDANRDKLLTAVKQGDVAAVKALLDSGANVETRNDSGRTLLMLAALKAPPDVVKLLLERGAQVNVQDTDGVTALMWGAFGGRADIVQMLLDGGADSYLRDRQGQTALEWGREHPAVAAVLRKKSTKP